MVLSPFYALRFLALFFSLAASSASAGLIGYWDFNTSGNVGADASGSGNTLMANGGAAFAAAGKFGGGLALNGSNSFLSKTTAVTGLPTGNSVYTISSWFKPTAAGDRGIVGWGNYGAVRQVNASRLLGANSFRHYWWGADLDASPASPNYSDGQWHHIVAVYDGTTRALWFDGVKIIQDTPGANGSSSANFRIGSTNNGEFFLGTLDDVAIWNVALTPSQIQNLAAGSSPLATGPQITAFTAAPASAFEGQNVQLSWTVNTSGVTGAYSYEIVNGATVLASGTAASGTFNTAIPSLAGTAQTISYTFRAIETGGNNLTNTATAEVAADPGQPIANPQSGLIAQQPNPLPITLSASDPNGGTLTYSIVAPPAHGTLSGAAPSVTYTPAAGYVGADSFSFKANDGIYDSPAATVRITVDAPPTAPTGITLSNSTVKDTATTGSFVAEIGSLDPNVSDPHTYELVAGEGATDNARFSVSGHQLRAAQSFTGLAGQQFSIRLRSTDSGGRTFEKSFALTAVTPQRGLVINEILFNGVNNTVRDEFIELYNGGTTTVDLTGWRLSGAIGYAFPANTQVAPGAFLLIAEHPATIQTRFAKTALGPWTGSLSSGGETIRLRNAADSTVSEVDYAVGFPWPVASDGDGTSIELINPALDESHGSNWRPSVIPSPTATTDLATPGVVNRVFAANAAPAVRQVAHTPVQPAGGEAIVVTARITDPDGVASAQLLYQLCAPGNFIPSTLPRAISNGQFVGGTGPLPANPAFENAANWSTLAMNDEGLGADVQGGDGTWTGSIPPQAHRTLVRYRIAVADNLGINARAPYADDKSLNFACFVYDGVPAYQGTSVAALTSLPVYHFLTREADYTQAVGYNSALWLADNTLSRTFENWTATFVYNGVVYDHIRYRLKGANGRYQASGVPGAGVTSKRAFKFVFNKGYAFQGHDNDGEPYPTTWSTIITENLWENRATYTFSLNEVVTFHLFNALGVPAPLGNWAHFRTVKQAAEQPDAWRGDFWGLMYVHEDYDKEFLEAHDLADGNLYKLTRDGITGLSQLRYQAPFAPSNGSDHDELQNGLRGTSTPAYITGRVNLDLWARYHALAEAVRHYDYWPSGDNNAAYYFEPIYNAANNNKGVLWYLPNDVDATWGPTWNNGHDLVHNALFNDAASLGGDSATNPTLWPRYFNQVREVRDLLFQPDQLNPLIDEFAAVIQPFVNAEFKRWFGAPADAGNFAGLGGAGMSSSVGQTSLAAYVADMKDFAFDPNNNGGSWPDRTVGVGGRAAFLDTLQAANGEGSLIPNTPMISAAGGAGFPVNDLRFNTSAFVDPQGPGTFAAMQWRMADVTIPIAPGEKRRLEITASYDSGEVAAGSFRFPAASAVAGRTYRARVRHKDSTGRWSHWSAPVQFTATAASVAVYQQSLVISEIMYHPPEPSAAEAAQGWAEEDFEYVELRNVSAETVDLSDVRFTKGVDYDFGPGAAIAAGANALIVRNPAAFTARYGAGRPVVGTWQAGNLLSNGGEEVKLSFGAGTAITAVTYRDVAPWPTSPDGAGTSLVRIQPENLALDPNLAANWRASLQPGGSPGADDRPTFAAWAGAHGGASDPLADGDFDGLTNLLEYALKGDPGAGSTAPLPASAVQTLTVAGVPGRYLTLTFRRLNAVEDIRYFVEFSADMAAWPLGGVLVSSTDQGDGTRTEVWRAPQSVAAGGAQLFGRLRVEKP